MANWDADYEAQKLKDYEGRFTVNFKKIYMDVDEINEKTLEVNEKHPKDSLMKLWAGTMCGMFIFFLLSYQVLALATIPFLIFYLIALFRIGKCWKNFKYSAAAFWGMSVAAILLVFALAMVLQYFVSTALLS
ncbi:MAG: dolichyl-diphosphooligosaccharide--protein glycosyltransferase subunit 2 [Lachnospiraceae bacterium]|nr:dolichyl-diphosphooligosaccharide--protein glycosyltransferase subunit 2 [Lachnospiraceae bacterium]